MSSRENQLGSQLCKQDQLLVNIINGSAVRIVGPDIGFKDLCTVDPDSDFAIVFLNQPAWLSEMYDQCLQNLTAEINKVYIGINRYQIKGNDTYDHSKLDSTAGQGEKIINLISLYISSLGFSVKTQGHYDNDRGAMFNFIQPLTWIYAERTVP